MNSRSTSLDPAEVGRAQTGLESPNHAALIKIYAERSHQEIRLAITRRSAAKRKLFLRNFPPES